MPTAIFRPRQITSGKLKKLVLVDARRSDAERQSHIENQYNLALGWIGAAVLDLGYEVMIVQQDPRTDSEDALLEEINSFQPDVAGYSSFSYCYQSTLAFKKKLEAKLERKPVSILGGIHASTSMEDCVHDFDYLIIGEGEETIRELLLSLSDQSAKQPREITGICYDREQKMMFTGQRQRTNDLDRFGPPLRLYFPLERAGVISPVPDDITGFAPISFGRGCVKDCTFCTNRKVYGSGKGAQVSRDPKKIVDEMQELYIAHRINYFWTHDEDFLFDTENLEAICDEILKRRDTGQIGQIYFGGMGSVSALRKGGEINHNLLKKLAEAGCIKIAFGIERATDDAMQDVRKGITTERAIRVLQETFDAGIAPVALFIYGLPEETKESLNQMLQYAATLPAIRYRFAPAYPLRGTFFRALVDNQHGWIDERFKQDKYADCETPVLKTKIASSVQDVEYSGLLDFERQALRFIYSSEKYGARINKFMEKTGDRFLRFFSKTWREYVEQELLVKTSW